jgi:DNA repair photolyase
VRPHLTSDDQLVGIDALVASSPHIRSADALVCPVEGLSVAGGRGLRVRDVEDLGMTIPMYDITTGTGDFIADGVVSHNCFARPSHTWLDLDAGRDFEKVVVVKVNAVERLRAELRRRSWQGESVALGTNTDPYQRAEGRYRLTRGVVQTLADAGNPFSVLTKGTLVTRDLDILADAAARGICTGVSMSIPTLDEQVWRTSEPGTPHPRARMETIARLSEAGIPTGVMLAPIIPGMSDDHANLDAVVRAAVEAGAGHITPILLHLRPGVREVFLPWLAEVRPDLVAAYERWYPRTYAPTAMRDALARRVARLIERHGPLRTTSTPRLRDPSPAGRAAVPAGQLTPEPDGEQLSLL